MGPDGTGGNGTRGGAVSPPVAVAFATVGYVALLVFAMGMLSLVLDAAVIEAPGLGPVPGAVAFAVSAAAFAAVTFAIVRVPHPSFWGALWAAAACFLAYLAGVWTAASFTGADGAVAVAVTARIATTGFGAAIALAGFVAAWAAVALVRTRAHRPRWPWERGA